MSAKKLVVVESPAKAKTLSRYLGRDFVVKASVGHVVDLPKNKLGVDVDNDFQPEYEIIHGKGKIIAELKSALKGKDAIYLGPDPDREGEAIAYHLAEKVVPKGFKGKVYRVLFNEITKNAVRYAIDNPVEIDSHKFEAQQARRLIDRLVGYQISPLLWEKVRRGLSAGRVQSVAVRLIVERERDITAFRQVEYWQITATLEAHETPFSARLVQVGKEKIETRDLDPDDPKCFFLRDEAQARDLVSKLTDAKGWKVATVKETRRQRKPAPPFITSTLQQEASRKHGFQPRRTMSIAQRLYEGVEVGQEGMTGLITYMRTDSTRSAPDAISAVRGYIEKNFGSNYVPEKPNAYTARKNAQDAHEAIRPTSMDLPPDRVRSFLEPEALKLYTLIWNRFVASQMPPAAFDQTSADIEAADCVFRATGQVLRFDGFLRVYQEGRDQPEDDDESGALPPLVEGDKPEARAIDPTQHFTQPPPRYTQASLIRTLEEKGIGRPSTYATIMSTIIDREYVKQDEQKRLVPTQLGILVTELLVESFADVLNDTFTAELEGKLDGVEAGETDWLKLTREFYAPFKADLERAKIEMRDVKRDVEETDLPCENCGRKLVIKWGRNGEFLACPGYPECRFTSNFTRDDTGSIKLETPETTGEVCEKCGADMVFKFGRFGKFLGCSNYPECRNVKSTRKSVPLGIACPPAPMGCGEGKMLQKASRRGKIFYGCDQYPKCKFATWDRPIENPCPQCAAPFVVEKTTKRAGTVRKCIREGCDYSENMGEGFAVEEALPREAEGA